jgi:hypothetical protein
MRKNAIFQTGAVAEAWATALLHRQPNLLQRILVVDDDPLIRQLNLEVLGYSALHYSFQSTGEDWQAFEQARP